MPKPKPEEPLTSFLLRLPRSMHQQLSKDAEEAGISLNGYIVAKLLGSVVEVKRVTATEKPTRETMPRVETEQPAEGEHAHEWKSVVNRLRCRICGEWKNK